MVIHTRRSRILSIFAAIGLAMVVAGTASAYWAQTPHTVTVFGRRNVQCNEWVTFRAVIRDHDGKRIPNGGPVDWSFKKSPSGNDQISPAQSDTNSRGVATTQVKLACVPGERVLRAVADEAKGRISIRLKIKDKDDDDDDDDDDDERRGDSIYRAPDRGDSSASTIAVAWRRVSGELPNTSTAPSSFPQILAILALAGAATLVLRRSAYRR